MKIRHVLLPTDLSTEALRPCAPVASLAEEQGARVTLLHVVPDLRIAPHGAPLAPTLSMPDVAVELQEAQRELERLAGEFGPGLEIKVEVIAAVNTALAICEYAKKHGADLIALSTHGRTGFRHLALGSVAEAVVRHSEVPVLSFPRPRN